MTLETANRLTWRALGAQLTPILQALTDDEMADCLDWLLETVAGTFRDLELALDLTGNRDAPL